MGRFRDEDGQLYLIKHDKRNMRFYVYSVDEKLGKHTILLSTQDEKEAYAKLASLKPRDLFAGVDREKLATCRELAEEYCLDAKTVYYIMYRIGGISNPNKPSLKLFDREKAHVAITNHIKRMQGGESGLSQKGLYQLPPLEKFREVAKEYRSKHNTFWG